jgi:predicted dehydrogenase
MTTRRTFLGSALATASVAATARSAAANNKVTLGLMGCGGRGTGIIQSFAKLPDVEVAYVSDPDEKRMSGAAAALEKIGKPAPKTVTDFRKMLDDKSVDAIICAAPNHWHAPAGILACSAGKHAYIEKPCSHTPKEGEMLVEAATKNNRIVQMGNQRRSFPKIQEAIAKLKEGVIGRAYYAQAWYINNRPSIGTEKDVSEVPVGLDYELWQGPSARKDFHKNFLHYNWHWFWNWGNGELGNNGIHMIDVMRWGLDAEFPTKVTSSGGRYRYSDDQETPDTHTVGFEFPGRKQIVWEGFSCNNIPREKPADIQFCGENGTLTINGSNYTIYDVKGKEIEKTEKGAGGDGAHFANFIESVRGDAKLNSPITEGHKSTLLCHLGNIAHRTGRTLKCSDKDGKIENDADAMKLWSKEYAKGFEPKV